MTSLQNFTFVPGISLRTTILNNEPWFMAKDVCDACGMTNASEAVSVLDPRDRNTINFSDGKRGNPIKLLVSESGFYSLVMRSNKPQAREFQRWVTTEVLPAIRKDGGYVTEATAQAMVDDPEVMLSKALLFATNRLKVAEEQVITLSAQNVKLEIRGKGLEEDAVPEMTVKQFILSRKIAATKGQRIALGHKATVLGEVAGRAKIKVAREFIGNDGEVRQGVAGFYPLTALERAATAMGLKENSYA
jgi:anti-repressor protein